MTTTRDMTFADVADSCQPPKAADMSPVAATLLQATEPKLAQNLALVRALVARGQSTNLTTVKGVEDRLIDFHLAADLLKTVRASVAELSRAMLLQQASLNDQIKFAERLQAAFKERDHGKD
jgi:hypothetical protein